ncbi:MAG TPA: ATP-binding protein [Actinomycetes bacterium]
MAELRGERVFPGRPDQVGAARGFVAAVLDPMTASYDAACLLTSEAVTNALLHSASGSEAGSVRVSWRLRNGRLRVEIHDDGGTLDPHRRVHHVESVTGRGFDLFEALSSGWGFAGGPSGRVVWFELDLEGRSEADGAGRRSLRPSAPRAQSGSLRGGSAGGATARAAA